MTHNVDTVYRLGFYTLYSLEKLIEWKPKQIDSCSRPHQALYSLEKLIEWKLGKFFPHHQYQLLLSLYSLEKLIEWKRGTILV